jgi:prophage regulatory protein
MLTTLLEPHLKERVIPLTRILRKKEVLQLCGIGSSYMYRLISEDTFPKPVNLSPKIVGWVDTEIQEWVENKIALRDNS